LFLRLSLRLRLGHRELLIGSESSGYTCAGLKIKTAKWGEAAMDELDRLSLEAAINTLQAETEFPGSQKPTSIEIVKQILAQLEPSQQHWK